MRNFASEKTRSLFSAALTAPEQTYRPPAIEKSLAERRADREAVISLQKSLYKAVVKGERVECDDCPALKSLVEHIEEFAKAKYPKASKKVRECVSQKIPKLIDEGKPQDQAIAIAFSMCQESTEKDVAAPWMTQGTGSQMEETPQDAAPVAEEDKALGDELGDQEDFRAREAAEAAEAGGDMDDFTEHAINIVAEAIMRAKKGQKLNMTPEQASARAKKAWETRKKNQQAKQEQAGAGTAVAEEEPAAPSAPAAEEPAGAPVAAPAEEPTGAPAPPAEEPAAPTGGGSINDAKSDTSTAGDLVSQGDLAGAASAAKGMINSITAARDEAQQSGNAEAAQGLSDLLDQIGGVPGGLENLAAQGGVDEATQGQIKQTFDQIGARLEELSGAGAAPEPAPEAPAEPPVPEPMPEPAPEPAAEAPAVPPAVPPAPEAEPEAPPEPIAPSEPAPAAEPMPEPAPEPAAEVPAPTPEEAPPTPGEAPAEPAPAAAGEAQPKAGGHKKGKVSEKSVAKVQGVMKRNGFSNESEEMGELAYFKGTLGPRGRGRTVEQLKADFIENMNPGNYESSEAFAAAKQRMQATPAKDFAMILAAIHEDEEELGAVPGAAPAPAPVASSLPPQGFSKDAARLVRFAFDRVLENAKD